MRVGHLIDEVAQEQRRGDGAPRARQVEVVARLVDHVAHKVVELVVHVGLDRPARAPDEGEEPDLFHEAQQELGRLGVRGVVDLGLGAAEQRLDDDRARRRGCGPQASQSRLY